MPKIKSTCCYYGIVARLFNHVEEPLLAMYPRGSFNRGAIVCNCFDVSAAQINTVLAAGADLALLQRRLKCGTECCSCVPELKRMANSRIEDRGSRRKALS